MGFWRIDGKIPGGMNNNVTASIKARVKMTVTEKKEDVQFDEINP